jgi:predicted dehydrogenase
MSTKPRLSRRHFLQQAAAAGLFAPAIARWSHAAPPSETVRHASFGGAGMARADVNGITSHPQVKLVCIAEVDVSRAGDMQAKFPDLRVYQDWREMLDKEAKNLDCVNVSTPDHMHAPMAMSAMNRGLHVYGQKPLTHDIYESRRLAEVAKQRNLVTQMGIQVHSSVEYRTAVQLIQQGTIGPVHTVHSWSEKKWGDPSPRPDRSDPVPDNFHWDHWLGVCAERPFLGGGYYHPGNWRKRLDFGTGTFGDMGCHILDPVCKALELTAPTSVRSVGNQPNEHNWANDVVVEFNFPATKHTAEAGVELTWYDGDRRPPAEALAVLGDTKPPGQGSLFIGTKGALLLPHVAMPTLFPEAQFASVARPELERVNHWHSFVDAIRGQGTPSANFSYAGPLTEWVLLGGVATRFPNQTLNWDAAALKVTNVAAANKFIRRDYRRGWEVEGLS